MKERPKSNMFPNMRRSKQALPLAESLAILEKAPTGVLGVLDGDGYPYTVPLNYVYQDGQIYFHCAKAGHKLESLQRHDKVSFCVVAQDEVVPHRFATRYQSVVVFGRARVITDDAVRRIALRALIQKYSPAYIQEGDQEIESAWNNVCIVAIAAEQITGKANRPGL